MLPVGVGLSVDRSDIRKDNFNLLAGNSMIKCLGYYTHFLANLERKLVTIIFPTAPTISSLMALINIFNDC
jgi:hypothetical protein